ncbi:GPI ethanolamine phosphate transferase 1-like isoform X2 [Mercenaria mercenaria]|uniref:GPI ethanolamine phosphate transferase 1-like isoform X2 n=1 Tax=Mercenaria mercenaria TaxID=6596 RepID=UPI00234E4DD7|nr:GPI ethanolamine phosphate transferase 1-like isoform X2 [Mercenaria mercenaria]
MKMWLVIAVGMAIHAIFFFSIFEIYFATPLVNGMTPHRSPLKPPAKRLVFIVADGLRADKIMELMPNGKSPAPFLRNIIQTKGAWGVSHAAVPTATRPGHVALTAGFYEDPTSVAKDLQGKEVMFDTVFNESQYTWSWDTPKFLAKVTGGNANRMFSKKYPGHMKWLAGINAEDMDSWVFKETHELLESAKTDSVLKSKMAEDQILFFLHLGGLDHSGYIVRPNSEAYLNHISYVDEGVKKVVEGFEEHYNNDGNTAFVFTSDHGMTDWGAHGDGTPDETLTPLIAWGPGLRTPAKESKKYRDGLSKAWSLTGFKRTDINQASMAAFLAALVGIPFPMNSVLPVPDQMFNITDHEMSEMLFANLRQLLAQCETLRDDRQSTSMRLTFSPFRPLDSDAVTNLQNDLQTKINSGRYSEAIDEVRRGIDLALKGIRYYTTYDRQNLWFSIVSSYIGWMIYLVSLLYEDHCGLSSSSQGPQLSRRIKGLIMGFFGILSVIIFMVLYVQSTTWTHYFFILLPCPIWMAVLLRFDVFKQMVGIGTTIVPLLPYLMLTFAGLEVIVMGFYYREIMSFGLVCFAAWPWIFKKDEIERRILIHWSVSCLTVAFFPAIPTGTRELNFNLVVVGGLVAIAVACFIVKTFATRQLAKRKLFLIFGFQIFILAVSIFIMRHTAEMAATNRRTPLISQTLSWIFLGLGIIEPFLVTTDIRCRLFSIALAWMSPFILFSISYECLFMVVMCWHLYIWMLMEANLVNDYKELPTQIVENGNAVNGKGSPEHSTRFLESLDFATISNQIANGKSRQNLVRADLRRSFYFIFLLNASLFGTGNLASVNSFDPAAVFCF